MSLTPQKRVRRANFLLQRNQSASCPTPAALRRRQLALRPPAFGLLCVFERVCNVFVVHGGWINAQRMRWHINFGHVSCTHKNAKEPSTKRVCETGRCMCVRHTMWMCAKLFMLGVIWMYAMYDAMMYFQHTNGQRYFHCPKSAHTYVYSKRVARGDFKTTAPLDRNELGHDVRASSVRHSR